MTSFGVVHRVRRAVGIKKVGHAGTLDPFATGVLILGIGRSATKRLNEFMMLEKEYLARVVLGRITDSGDLTGKLLEENDFDMPDENRVRNVLAEFVGEIKQLPPIYSAIKMNGVRLYKLARKGIEVEREPRKVLIKVIELVNLTDDGFNMRVLCSKGTYIRSLAFDIGQRLGCGAHLGALTRVRIGEYTLEGCEELEQFVTRVTNREEL